MSDKFNGDIYRRLAQFTAIERRKIHIGQELLQSEGNNRIYLPNVYLQDASERYQNEKRHLQRPVYARLESRQSR